MATFNNCHAQGNLSGGFFTDNPYSAFINCRAKDNHGFGFVDESGNRLREECLQRFEKMKKDVANNSTFDDKEKTEIHKELEAVTTELKNEAPKNSIIKWSLKRLQEITKEHIGEITARSIFEFASELISRLSEAG